MKKVTAVFIVLLLIMFSYTALAETQYGENPWTNENSKIYVFEDFSGTFEGEDWTKYPNYWSFAAYSGEDPLKGSVTNGAMTFPCTDGESKWDAFFFGMSAPLESEMFSVAKGFGFYVKNSTAADIYVSPYGQGGNSETNLLFMYSGIADETLIIDMQGTLDYADVYGVADHICIPSGFEGYIVMPMSHFYNGHLSTILDGTSALEDASNYTLTQIGLRINNVVIENDESFIIDDFFIYGENLPEEKTGDVKVTKPSGTQTESPSASAGTTAGNEPSSSASVTTGATQGVDTPASSTPWGLIIGIAAAVLIVAAVVLIVVSKQNKGKQGK